MNKIKEIKKAIDTELDLAPEETRAVYASLLMYTVGNYVIYDFAYTWENIWQLTTGLLMCLLSTIVLIIIAEQHANEFEEL